MSWGQGRKVGACNLGLTQGEAEYGIVSEGAGQSWTMKTLSLLLSESPRSVLIFCFPKCGSCYIDTASKLFIIQLDGTYLGQGTLFSNKYRILKQIQCYRMARKLCPTSVQLVMSNSLRPHELQHVRPFCPSPTPGVHPISYPLSR